LCSFVGTGAIRFGLDELGANDITGTASIRTKGEVNIIVLQKRGFGLEEILGQSRFIIRCFLQIIALNRFNGQSSDTDTTHHMGDAVKKEGDLVLFQLNSPFEAYVFLDGL
jgi:hypothetical protein